MKNATLAITVLASMLPVAAALAQQKMDDMKGMDTDKKPAPGETAKTHATKGTVKQVNTQAGTVTVAHEPVPSMKWPAMTMAFKVTDKKLLDKLSAGKRVEFEFTQQGKDYVISAVK